MSEAIYGTVYISAAHVKPRCVKRTDGGGVIVAFDAPGHYVTTSIVGTHDEVQALLAAASTAVADSEEPRFEFEDIPPHPRVDVVSHRFASTHEGEAQ